MFYNAALLFIQLIVVVIATLYALRLGAPALIGLMSLLIVCANLFVCKCIDIVGFEVTATDALAVGAGLCLNLLREFYGAEQSKRAIGISFFLLIVFLLIGQTVLWFEPSSCDHAHALLSELLALMPRLVIASLIAYAVSQTFDWWLYGYLKKQTGSKFFALRNLASLSLSQLIDTILFTVIGLWGIVPNPVHVIIFCYAAKFLTACITSSMIGIAHYFYLPSTPE